VHRSLLDILACPRDHIPLRDRGNQLTCSNGHQYPVVDGIPVFLLAETCQTHIEGTRSLAAAEAGVAPPSPFDDFDPNDVDPFVKEVIAATNGSFYKYLVGKLTEYPIPHLRLPPGEGKLFLEIGCNWGRWCVAAARAGYRAVGIDPSLKSLRAARRVAQQLGVEVEYVVGDGRHLPIGDASFGQVFSYSVLQHLSKENTRTVLHEAARVLRTGGGCLIQMPNVFGIRCLYHQTRRGFRDTRDFEVRYWAVNELRRTFRDAVGPSRVFVDGYFSLNPQISDIHLFPRRYRTLVRLSEALRKMSDVFSPLTYVADSLYVASIRH
jgi:SAM-dependent methyltransferase/uncharacterized protein YbaR (Trm112 family)